MTDILLVEDDPAFVQLLENFLRKKGYSLSTSPDLKEARDKIQNDSYQLILLDYHLPDGTAFDFMEHLQAGSVKSQVIIMTGFRDVRTVVKAMRLGVADYITKPVNPEELIMTIEQTLKKKQIISAEPGTGKDIIKGKSEISQELNRYVDLVAPTNLSVIIQGESGTGKENIARRIHQSGSRAAGPFMAIDCGALSDELASSELFGHVKGAFTGAVSDKKGVFELAKGGTLFLDEVGNLSYAVQVKLLRAIQEREIQAVGGSKPVKVDVRIITATNEDLRLNIKNGGFREDLFHRLNEFSILVPPLRERKGDLELFINHFIQQSNGELARNVKSISKEVQDVFKSYSWPGNLRELKNIIRRSVLLAAGEEIRLQDIPPEMSSGEPVEAKKTGDLKQMNETNEKDLILKTLQEVKFNKTKAAARLNIDRKTLYLKMAKYGIDA